MKCWEEQRVKVDDRDFLVVRAAWGKEKVWKLAAWLPVSKSEGTFWLNGHWYRRPDEEIARRAIAVAFPDAQGDWVDHELVEADPAKR